MLGGQRIRRDNDQDKKDRRDSLKRLHSGSNNFLGDGFSIANSASEVNLISNGIYALRKKSGFHKSLLLKHEGCKRAPCPKSAKMQVGKMVAKAFLKENFRDCLSKIRRFILEPAERIEEKFENLGIKG
jgi:hypothetical protein